MTSMHRITAAWCGLALALPLTACGGDAEVPDAPIVYDADATVLVHDTGGGAMSRTGAFLDTVDLVVEGDGTLVRLVDGDHDRMLAPLERTRLGEEQVQEVLRLAAEQDLLAEAPEYDSPQITDAGGVQVLLDTAEGTTRHSAYALFQVEDPDDEQQRLIDFVRALEEFADGLDGYRPYLPEQVRVTTGGGDLTDGGDPPARRWNPAWGDLDRARTCLVVDDPRAIEVLAESRQGAVFDGVTVYATPVLAGDGCADWE